LRARHRQPAIPEKCGSQQASPSDPEP
jgi:hypothetical protein